MNNDDRYARQRVMPDLGVEAQAAWANAHVAIIGMGGLGCGVAMALVSSGIGRLTICDGDGVTMSNLHRQWLYDERHLGQSKVLAAENTLKQMRPDIQIYGVNQWLDRQVLKDIVDSGIDFIVDATDQIETKYTLDAGLKSTPIPWVFGAAEQWEGRVTTLNFPDAQGRRWHLSDFYGENNRGFMLGSCLQRGILPPVVQAVSMLQAIEVLRALANLMPNYVGRMLIWDAGTGTFLSPTLQTSGAKP